MPTRKSAGPSPKRSGALTARVYERLREEILDGVHPQGTHLSIQSIATSMRTSNGPVITALHRLAHEGLVQHGRGSGYRIAEWTPLLLDQLLVVRRALETEAARLAARLSNREDIDELQTHIAQMEAMVAEGRRADAERIDVELHVAIAKLSRNAQLIDALARSHMLEIVRRRLLANAPRGDFKNMARNHQILIDAIASGDPDEAGKAMHWHLRSKSSTTGNA
ncbi:HTH-type transcriptional regulator LutR [Caulifigura coniformis]|uniref:HTH-type transcriptional regulator LutR n=1 Tax=Caulifigura coniformis TaxID=2527983 RepID=A0A517SEM6_9PLAN|nr:GntR family transcriptional regulator [Caulifigura coniformis]QDT54580.1 HTH-type transcriptional regulator LutR [Caulifigura coniformis]